MCRYEEKYLAVRSDSSVVNSFDPEKQINALFSPDAEGTQAVDQLITWIDEEQDVVLVWVFTLRNVMSHNLGNRTLYDGLVEAKERGAVVVVATDKNMVEQSDHK